MIMHVDMNAYFATLEQQWDPHLRGKPIIVCGKGSSERTVVATASYEAKRLGVKNGMAVWQAKRICPQAILVPAQYQKYVATTKKIMAIFESFTPDVEVFSIDEAFLSIKNLESSIKVAHQIKQKIKQEIGDYCTCSIGIAENKLLAKIASEYQKPDGLTIVSHQPNSRGRVEPEELLRTIKLDAIPGIGRRMLARLDYLQIKTIPDLQTFSEHHMDILIQEFGASYAAFLYGAARGIDNSPLVRFREAPDEKSFGHSYTLPKEIYRLSQAKAMLLHLAEKVGERMRAKGFLGRTVHVWLRFTDMTSWGKQTTILATNDGYQIYKAGEGLIENYLPAQAGELKSENSRKRIRAVGISCSNLTKTFQPSLFPNDHRRQTIPKILDSINQKHGSHSLLRAQTLAAAAIRQDIPDGRDQRLLTNQ